MGRKISIARKNQDVKIQDHDILNFKGIKKISFPEFIENNKNKFFNRCSIKSLFGKMTLPEAKFKSDWDVDFLEYLYIKRNNIIPLHYKLSSNKFNRLFITDFFSFLKPPVYTFKATEYYNGEKNLELIDVIVVIEEDIIMFYDGDLHFFIDPCIHLKYSKENPFHDILCLLCSYKKREIKKNKINIVYREEFGFEKIAFDIKKVNIDINLNYNDDFKEISEYIIKCLNDIKKTGLYILSGETGTGKTYFIRYLASMLKREIIFIPPDMVDHITDPSFIPFLMNNNNSILIIEDAEPALQKRDGISRSGAISNILNITDGLLSDCLNISIVTTFNTNSKTIDEALLRRGRLVKSYKFEKLEVEKANNLLKKIGADFKTSEPMTLAEIYNHQENNITKEFLKKKIGFKTL